MRPDVHDALHVGFHHPVRGHGQQVEPIKGHGGHGQVDFVFRVYQFRRQLHLEGGGAVSYDRLLVASGSRAVVPPIDGIDSPGVHACWTLEDARQIMGLAAPGARVVLIGAGFTLIGSLGLLRLRDFYNQTAQPIVRFAYVVGRAIRARDDGDADGLVNYTECVCGTDPNDPDTNSDAHASTNHGDADGHPDGGEPGDKRDKGLAFAGTKVSEADKKFK